MKIDRPELTVPMRAAIELAQRAAATGDIPIGAVVTTPDGTIIGPGWNTREATGDPTGHAEINALREAGKHLGRWRLDECILTVTLEPCAMCAGATVLARLNKVVFGAWDPKAGACGSLRDITRDTRLNHNPQVIGGVLEDECQALLAAHFTAQRGDNVL